MNTIIDVKRKNEFWNIRTITTAAMLIALNIILTRYLSIQTQFLRIGFGFLPVAIFSMLYGPVAGAAAAAVADVAGFFLFPSGTFFPGFTFTALVSGMIYGLLLYKHQPTLLRITLTCLVTVTVCDAVLNTLWLSILYHQPIALIIGPRIIKAAIMLPIQAGSIYLLNRFLISAKLFRRIQAVK